MFLRYHLRLAAALQTETSFADPAPNLSNPAFPQIRIVPKKSCLAALHSQETSCSWQLWWFVQFEKLLTDAGACRVPGSATRKLSFSASSCRDEVRACWQLHGGVWSRTSAEVQMLCGSLGPSSHMGVGRGRYTRRLTVQFYQASPDAESVQVASTQHAIYRSSMAVHASANRRSLAYLFGSVTCGTVASFCNGYGLHSKGCITPALNPASVDLIVGSLTW